jgi:hypothetical protein
MYTIVNFVEKTKERVRDFGESVETWQSSMVVKRYVLAGILAFCGLVLILLNAFDEKYATKTPLISFLVILIFGMVGFLLFKNFEQEYSSTPLPSFKILLEAKAARNTPSKHALFQEPAEKNARKILQETNEALSSNKKSPVSKPTFGSYLQPDEGTTRRLDYNSKPNEFSSQVYSPNPRGYGNVNNSYFPKQNFEGARDRFQSPVQGFSKVETQSSGYHTPASVVRQTKDLKSKQQKRILN